MDSVFIN